MYLPGSEVVRLVPEVLPTKLSPPRLGNGIIERPRLIERLTQAETCKLILMAAPAGYGKSVLARQYTDVLNCPSVWYQLDGYDNDPVVFVQYLVAGFRRYFPNFGAEALQIIRQGALASRLRLLVVTLVNDLIEQAGSNPIIILDDYHVITEPLIHRLNQELLDRLPAGVRLLIAGRAAPPLALSRLKVAGEALVLGPAELRFTAQECRIFLTQKHQGLSQQVIETLESKTAGWPAALKLLGDSTDSAFSLPILATKEVYDYLAAEVLDRQPEAVRRFLTVTSVLEALTPEDCDALLERDDSAAMLESLMEHQLFLIPLAGGVKAFRYHQLFREFLLDRLGDEKSRWRRRAGEIARQKGDSAGAVEYLLAAGELNSESVGLLRVAGREALRRGRWRTVQRWLACLPEERKAADPWLSFFQAEVEVYRGRLEEAESWLKEAISGFSAPPDRAGLGECRLLQARILRGRGLYQKSLELLEQAEECLRASSRPAGRFDLPLEKSLLLIMTGKLKEAEELLTGALAAAEKESDGCVAAHLLEGLGHVYYLLGDYPRALRMYQKGADLSPDRTLPGYYTQDFIAAIYAEWGELETALEFARRNVEIKEKFGLAENLPSAYYQLASVHIDRGEPLQAEEYCNRAINLIMENGGEHFYLTLNRIILARCLCLQGRLAEARQTAEDALQKARAQSGLLLAICRVVYAGILAQTGEVDQAGMMLREAAGALEAIGFQQALGYCYSALAAVSFSAGDEASAGEYSRKTLELSAKRNFLQSFVTFFEQFQPVLKFGLEQGIEVPFIQRILTRLGGRAAGLLKELAGHPDPQVRSRLVPLLPQSEDSRSEILSRSITYCETPESGGGFNIKIGLQAGGTAPENCLHIQSLGPLRVFWGQSEIAAGDWRSGKARDLLVYLAHRGEPATMERILEDLWPEEDLKDPVACFHTTLYRLRRALQKVSGEAPVRYDGGRCSLSPGSCILDRRQFEELLAPDLTREPLTETGASRLEKAIALYRGDYLEDLDYPWIVPYREHLKRLYLEANLKLARYCLQKKDYLGVVAKLGLLTGLDPLSEEIRRLLMTAYAGLGDRLAARKQYLELTARLAEELGLEPAAETRELYCRLCGTEE